MGIVSIINTFPSYKVSDFYGNGTNQPMSAPQFFALIGIAEYYIKKLKNKGSSTKYGRNKR